ncbi:ATP-binding protein [Tenacibaculum sp. IB213877]|uniref:ATP-binding protein n=1 Tax=Tenacibaculum sp. IB213877 TaxID=3097351 RepID=UPI002A5A1C56|nr:ATP-binding protein [Tenacibaculum sp. IB213877]MDY0779252.1 ATP-binding protein [Tenacibaculum sp. IB213877]
MQQKIVFIGGPGTGKSTILNELMGNGHTCMPEISREITLQAKKDGIEQLFLTDPLLFSQKILEGREQQYIQSNDFNTDVVFFDRGIPSVHAYLRYFKTEFPAVFLEKSKQYKYTKVFQFLPWKDIYTSDNERYETYEESVIISKFLHDAYTELGYHIIEVPFGTIKERYDFILNSL